MPTATTSNPFSKSGPQDSVTTALYTSKNIAQELRHDDAAMVADLTALVPRGGRRYRILEKQNHGKNDVTPGFRSSTHDREETAVSFKEVQNCITTDAFLSQKREVGLIRMSLATRKKEIRKLEEDIERAEKRLRQQRDQLENTRAKFNSFLKHSNLEQDAAVRRADNEVKLKQEKGIEIKKLSGRISHVEMEIRKTSIQLESCKMYKKFLDDLTKPACFYDVLKEFRIADRTEEILLATEMAYEQHSTELRNANEAELSRRAALEDRRGYTTLHKDASISMEELPPLLPIEEQLEQLHSAMEAEARRSVAESTRAVIEEVNTLTLEQVKESLASDYPESRIPMHFSGVEELLDVFINVEEGNLFLIQNCQELEEELERVAMAQLAEKEDMRLMTTQRQAQMTSLDEKTRAAEEKLRHLDARSAALDNSSRQPHGSSSTTKKNDALGGRLDVGHIKHDTLSGSDLPPEVFKDRVERSIGGIFRTLTAGDNTIKALTLQLQRAKQGQAQLLAMKEDGGDGGEELTHLNAKMDPALMSTTSAKSKRAIPEAKKAKDPKDSTQGGAAKSDQGDPSISEAGVNMGPLEMLTIIENKLEEYHRFTTDTAHGVDDALILSVMKSSDKERRRQARLLHLANQEREQEEKSRRALERSRAPVVRRTGKPVLRRSRLVPDEGQTEKGAFSGHDGENDGDEFFT